MSVSVSLLAILDLGSCYGYQLRAELDRRTGGLWQINVGQIYRTLERLERDGAVTRGETGEHGHVYWTITASGRSLVRDWLGASVPQADVTRDELAMKIAVAATLPGTDVDALVRAQYADTLALVQRLRARADEDDTDDAATLARQIAQDAQQEAAHARLRWLERTQSRLRNTTAAALALSTEPPRRGRPPVSGAGGRAATDDSAQAPSSR